MNKNMIIIVALILATKMNAQFFVSANGGYAMGSAGVLMGTELNQNNTVATNKYGSFGEGFNAQIKGGYFFNDTFGFEIGIAYLHGADQIRDNYKATDGIITEILDAKGYGRAWGLSGALIYNFNEKVYGKFGAITKLTRTNPTPFGNIVATGKQDFHGRLPLGFIAALGHKFKLTDNLNFFAELEYLGINVTRDNSEFTELTITAPEVPANALGDGHPGIPAATWNLGDAPIQHLVTLYAPTEINYVDSLSTTNSDPSKTLSEVVPYSSFGINFGITYTFEKIK